MSDPATFRWLHKLTIPALVTAGLLYAPPAEAGHHHHHHHHDRFSLYIGPGAFYYSAGYDYYRPWRHHHHRYYYPGYYGYYYPRPYYAPPPPPWYW